MESFYKSLGDFFWWRWWCCGGYLLLEMGKNSFILCLVKGFTYCLCVFTFCEGYNVFDATQEPLSEWKWCSLWTAKRCLTKYQWSCCFSRGGWLNNEFLQRFGGLRPFYLCWKSMFDFFLLKSWCVLKYAIYNKCLGYVQWSSIPFWIQGCKLRPFAI
jgi:hypothetical protein